MSKVVLYSFVKCVSYEREFENLEDAILFLNFNGFVNTDNNYYEKELNNGVLRVELVNEV